MMKKIELNELNNLPQKEINNYLKGLCIKGELDEIKFLLTSPDLLNKAQINHTNMFSPLQLAAGSGHLEITKYLLTSPDLKEHADIHWGEERACITAINNKHLKVAEFLISDDSLIEKVNTHVLLKRLCERRHLEGLKFITSKKFSNFVNIHHNDDEICKAVIDDALRYNNIQMLEYFLLEYNINETPTVKEILDANNDKFKAISVKRLNNELSKKDNKFNHKVKKI